MSIQANPPRNKRAKAQKWPRIRSVTHKNGAKAWMVDARKAGKGDRFFFKTKGEADTKAEQLRSTLKNQGAAGLAISDRLRVEAVELSARLAGVGATLTDAVEYFLAHAKPTGGIKTVDGVVKLFLKAKKQAGRRASYLDIQRSVLGYFGKTFGAREIHTVGHQEISEWMLAQPWQLRTQENYRRDLGNLFGFAVKHGHCASNPIDKLEHVTLDDKPPAILTVDEASRLLETAERQNNGALLPFVAIGLFCGLRVTELRSLNWEQVSLAERTVEVTAAKAKTRARRIVTISENLVEWLRPYERTSGPVTPSENFEKRWRKVRKTGQLLANWQTHTKRHCFASYHVAAHKNAPLTSLEMGHDNPNQLFASYRELVKPSDAAKYWALSPAKTDALVALAA